jgi:hypothetical protein
MDKNYFSADPNLNPLFKNIQRAVDLGRMNENQANKYLTIFSGGLIPMGSFTNYLSNVNQVKELPNIPQHQPQFNFNELQNQNQARMQNLQKIMQQIPNNNLPVPQQNNFMGLLGNIGMQKPAVQPTPAIRGLL